MPPKKSRQIGCTAVELGVDDVGQLDVVVGMITWPSVLDAIIVCVAPINSQNGEQQEGEIMIICPPATVIS